MSTEKIIETTVLGKPIEIYHDKKDYIYIYNVENNKMLKAKEEAKTYLENIEHAPDKLKKFLFSSYSRGPAYDFHFLRLIISMNSINPLLKLLRFITTPIVSLILLILNILFFFIVTSLKGNEILLINEDLIVNIAPYLVFLFVGSFIITFFHELGHFSVYNRYLGSKQLSFGLSIRYFTFLLFFTNTPFINTLTKNKKRHVILAGVQTQLFISIILFLLILLLDSRFFLFLYLQNTGMILINLIPFFKFDGYWFISSLLNTEDYMKSFVNIIRKQEKFNSKIFFLSVMNILLVCLIMLNAIFNTVKYFD